MNKSLETKVSQITMALLAQSLETSVNALFCGYLRQPIKIYEGKDNSHRLIYGSCSLRYKGGHYSLCVKEVPLDNLCEGCEYYKKAFDTHTP